MLACSAHCGPSVDADASVRHLSALWSCAAAGAAKRNFVVADFYFLEMSYLPGPISPPVLEMSYLPSRTRFLSPQTVLYVYYDHIARRLRAVPVACGLRLVFTYRTEGYRSPPLAHSTGRPSLPRWQRAHLQQRRCTPLVLAVNCRRELLPNAALRVMALAPRRLPPRQVE